MKFSEELLKSMNLNPIVEKEPVNVMQVREMLLFLKKSAERICQKSELYCTSKDADVQLDCLDIVALKLNDFTQAFRDLVIFIRKKDGATKTGKSLRYSTTSYDTLGFQQTDSEKDLLRELTIRNEITHDYFNYELHQQKLIWIIENCSKGAMDVYENLFNYCQAQNLLDCYVNNGEK